MGFNSGFKGLMKLSVQVLESITAVEHFEKKIVEHLKKFQSLVASYVSSNGFTVSVFVWK